MKEKRYCVGCRIPLLLRHQIKYCSNKCQMNSQYVQWVIAWKAGKKDGNIGITARNFSTNVKKYLIETYGNKCFLCGWNKQNPVTGAVPIEIDHIDGNSENSLESNLRLLCPNCHSLTSFYKNMNRGNGRKWRTDKYIKNIDKKDVK